MTNQRQHEQKPNPRHEAARLMMSAGNPEIAVLATQSITLHKPGLAQARYNQAAEMYLALHDTTEEQRAQVARFVQASDDRGWRR